MVVDIVAEAVREVVHKVGVEGPILADVPLAGRIVIDVADGRHDGKHLLDGALVCLHEDGRRGKVPGAYGNGDVLDRGRERFVVHSRCLAANKIGEDLRLGRVGRGPEHVPADLAHVGDVAELVVGKGQRIIQDLRVRLQGVVEVVLELVLEDLPVGAMVEGVGEHPDVLVVQTDDLVVYLPEGDLPVDIDPGARRKLPRDDDLVFVVVEKREARCLPLHLLLPFDALVRRAGLAVMAADPFLEELLDRAAPRRLGAHDAVLHGRGRHLLAESAHEHGVFLEQCDIARPREAFPALESGVDGLEDLHLVDDAELPGLLVVDADLERRVADALED